MTRPAEKCPLCCDRLVVPVLGRLDLAPCPHCRPAAPGRMLKAVPDQSLGAEEIARELGES